MKEANWLIFSLQVAETLARRSVEEVNLKMRLEARRKRTSGRVL